jgi:hypothetical protein
MMDAPISNPPALQNVALFRSTVFTEVINFKVITVVLVQYDRLPYKKGKSGHRHTTDQERMPCENESIGWGDPSTSQESQRSSVTTKILERGPDQTLPHGPQEEPTTSIPWL